MSQVVPYRKGLGDAVSPPRRSFGVEGTWKPNMQDAIKDLFTKEQLAVLGTTAPMTRAIPGFYDEAAWGLGAILMAAMTAQRMRNQGVDFPIHNPFTTPRPQPIPSDKLSLPGAVKPVGMEEQIPPYEATPYTEGTDIYRTPEGLSTSAPSVPTEEGNVVPIESGPFRGEKLIPPEISAFRDAMLKTSFPQANEEGKVVKQSAGEYNWKVGNEEGYISKTSKGWKVHQTKPIFDTNTFNTLAEAREYAIGKPQPTVLETSLESNAKKYKSAEEFVEGQNEYLYHNSSQRFLDDIKEQGLTIPEEGGYSHGIKDISDDIPRLYLSKDPKRALEFGGRVGSKYPETESALMRIKRSAIEGKTYEPELSGGETWLFDKGIKSENIEYYDRRADKWIPLKGKLKSKTKPQLTDIWNKANQSLKPSEQLTLKELIGTGILKVNKGDRVIAKKESGMKGYEGTVELMSGDTAKVRGDDGGLFTFLLSDLKAQRPSAPISTSVSQQATVDSYLKELQSAKMKNKSIMHYNSKTGISMDRCTSCEKRESGKGACLYCYVEHPRTSDTVKSEALEKTGEKTSTGVMMHGKTISTNEYNDEILKMPQDAINYANKEWGGIRVFSHSDYIRSKDKRWIGKALDHARQRGAYLKPITKTKELIEDYGNHPNIRINLSTDLVPKEVSNAMTPGEAKAFIGDRKNVVIRGVALNQREAKIMGEDPNVKVLTLYHGITNFDAKGNRTDNLLNIVTKQNPQAIKKMGGIDNLRAYLDTWENMGHNTLVFKGVAQKYPKKLCCQGGKCSKDPTKCGFADQIAEK